MKRKETKLEKNLQEYYYKLDYKTYEGKNSEKVSGYVYKKVIGSTTYIVSLDKTREHIVSYAFSNNHYDYFDKGKIEGLQDVLCFLGEELTKIYDFTTKQARELDDFRALEEDFIENIENIGGDDFND